MQYVIEQYGWINGYYSLIDSKVFSTEREIKEKSYNKNGYTFCITKLNEVQNKRRTSK